MKHRFFAAFALVASLGVARSMSGCVGDAPAVAAEDASTDASSEEAPGMDSNTAEPMKSANGGACAQGLECVSGFCADSVCCDAECKGSCESCNLMGMAGVCSAIPNGSDPDMECLPTPLPDAGQDPGDAGVSDAGSAADADPDANPDAQLMPNQPDGGVTVDDSKCAGSCNGKRACAYPDTTTTCGTIYCSTSDTQGRASCDSKGHCELGLEKCTAYSCPEGDDGGTPANGCLATCVSESDCLPTYYCDVGTCKPKLGNGTSCTSVPQCQSAHCVTDVCCNDECNVTGGSCTATGKVGQCSCPACATGSCKLWYRDRDSDGYGDVNATVANGDAIPGCSAGADGGAPTPPQVGFVEDNTDCFDVAGTVGQSVHPGQTGYFNTAYGPTNSFDYNCDQQATKQYVEDPGGSCGFCRGSGLLLCGLQITCTAANQQGSHECFYGFGGIKGGGGCQSSAQQAFYQTVACGGTGTLNTCGTCTATGGMASSSNAANVVQGCH